MTRIQPPFTTYSAATTSTALSSKIINITRDGTASSGDVSTTGIGFQPTSISIVTAVDNTSYWSSGHSDSSKTGYCIYGKGNGNVWFSNAYICTYSDQSTFGQSALIKTYDADGFTLTWTKAGSPPANTLKLSILCYK